MSRTGRKILVAGGLLVTVLLGLYAATRRGQPIGESTVNPAPDLTGHPLYSTYTFGKTEKVIDIGTQPLWLPISHITEAMKRDRILRKALEAEGLRIAWHGFWKGADVNFFLGRGDLEVGFGGDMPALTATTKFGAVVGGVVQHGFCSIVASRPLLVGELRGKRIGYPFGSSAHYVLLDALSSAGLSESDVRLVAMDLDAMPEALARGAIDALSAWEPIAAVTLARSERAIAIHRATSSGFLYFSRSFAVQNPAAARTILAAKLRAVGWIRRERKNLDLASRWVMRAERELTGTDSPLTLEEYNKLAREDLLGLSGSMAIPKSIVSQTGPLGREFEFLKRLGKLGPEASWATVEAGFSFELRDQVLADPARYDLRSCEYAK